MSYDENEEIELARVKRQVSDTAKIAEWKAKAAQLDAIMKIYTTPGYTLDQLLFRIDEAFKAT